MKAWNEYIDALGTLWATRGDISPRRIAARTNALVSHTTVHDVLRGSRLPPEGTLRLILDALRVELGDHVRIMNLWEKAAAERGSYGRGESAPKPRGREFQTAVLGQLVAINEAVARIEKRLG